ncbi:MAG: amidohydrolase family protein, partial [Acidimicrobiales bacterium]
MAHDLVIRNGTVVDGSGFGSYRADAAITGDRIAEVGRVRDGGRREIDAEGHAVTPGFIDGHTHMDAQVFWDATGSSSCWHGVTSVVMGNCGFTLAPVRSGERQLVVRNLERAEDIDPAALAEGIDWSFETFPQYLDAVDRLGKGISFAANIGHSALRTWAMGERAFEEEASEADLALMCGQLADALRAGAIGFSTSRTRHHETSDGRPVGGHADEAGVEGDRHPELLGPGPHRVVVVGRVQAELVEPERVAGELGVGVGERREGALDVAGAQHRLEPGAALPPAPKHQCVTLQHEWGTRRHPIAIRRYAALGAKGRNLVVNPLAVRNR